jgi:hypothetical protein
MQWTCRQSLPGHLIGLEVLLHRAAHGLLAAIEGHAAEDGKQRYPTNAPRATPALPPQELPRCGPVPGPEGLLDPRLYRLVRHHRGG